MGLIELKKAGILFRRAKLGIWLAAIFVVLALSIGMFFFGDILTFLLFFNQISERLAVQFSLDIWLARILAICIGYVFFFHILPKIFSLRYKNRRVGYMATAIVFIIIFFGSWISNRNTFFNPDGSARACMAWNPVEKKYEMISCARKVHPQYGTPVSAVSAEKAAVKNSMAAGLGEFRRVTPNQNLRFFTPDGAPLVWYHKHTDNRLEIFEFSGPHPQLGVPLAPMDQETASLIGSYLEQKKYQMIIIDRGIDHGEPQKEEINAGGVSGLRELRDYLMKLQK